MTLLVSVALWVTWHFGLSRDNNQEDIEGGICVVQALATLMLTMDCVKLWCTLIIERLCICHLSINLSIYLSNYVNILVCIYVVFFFLKTEHRCFNQYVDISTLYGGSLKLGDKFTYLGNCVSPTKNDSNTRLVKHGQLSIGYRSYGS